MEYKVYLFDFDYTLADSSRGIVMCYRRVLDRHGYTSPTDDDIRRTIGKTLEDSFALLTGVTDAGRLAEFRRQYVKEADGCMTANTVLFPETAGVLRRLKAPGRGWVSSPPSTATASANCSWPGDWTMCSTSSWAARTCRPPSLRPREC